MEANLISAHGTPVQNAAGAANLAVGSTPYTQVTAHGAGAGPRDYDLTNEAGKLALARAKTYDLNPRTGAV